MQFLTPDFTKEMAVFWPPKSDRKNVQKMRKKLQSKTLIYGKTQGILQKVTFFKFPNCQKLQFLQNLVTTFCTLSFTKEIAVFWGPKYAKKQSKNWTKKCVFQWKRRRYCVFYFLKIEKIIGLRPFLQFFGGPPEIAFFAHLKPPFPSSAWGERIENRQNCNFWSNRTFFPNSSWPLVENRGPDAGSQSSHFFCKNSKKIDFLQNRKVEKVTRCAIWG